MKSKYAILAVFILFLVSLAGCTNPYMSQAFAKVVNTTTDDLYVAVDSEVVLVPAGTTSPELEIGFCYQSTPISVRAGLTPSELSSLGQVEAHFGEVFDIAVKYDTLQSQYYFTSSQTYK